MLKGSIRLLCCCDCTKHYNSCYPTVCYCSFNLCLWLLLQFVCRLYNALIYIFQVKRNNSGKASNGNDKGFQPPKKAARTEHGVLREDTNQISSVPPVENTSQMESNDPSHRKLHESNGSTDQIEKSNVRASSSRAKFMEKSSSRNKSKKTLLGRASVCAIVICILLHIDEARIILQFK